MRKVLFCILFCFPFLLLAQSMDDNYYSITVGGGYTGAFTASSSDAIFDDRQNNLTYKDFINKTRKDNTMRLNFSAHAWYNKILGFNWTMQAGLGYMDMGYRYEQNDLKTGDYIYKGVGGGKVLDNSNVKKSINNDYRFHYLSIPVWFNYEFLKSGDYKTMYEFTGGVTATLLLKHQLTARLDNFTIDGEDKYQLNETGHDARTLNMQVNVGVRVLHKLDKETTIIIQPMYSIHPFSATNDKTQVYPYGIMLHAGIVVDLNKFRN